MLFREIAAMRYTLLSALVAAFMIGCSPAPDGAEIARGETAEVASETGRVAEGRVTGEADLVVYKSPTCGCCNGWVEHMREAGHSVSTVDLASYRDLQAKKTERGVPGDLGSCHTAVIEGYTIEGHVPADAVERLLRERPDIKGLAVPGMPIGSPGMEGPNPQPYEVIAFTEEGERSVFQTVDPAQPSSDTR